jgi:hypothetical protein
VDPHEVHASPHDLEGYDEPLFPVADTPIGRTAAICYDWLFPEAIRQLAIAAPKCWCACPPTWIRGARPSR